MASIAAKVKAKASAGTNSKQKTIDLSTAENWLVRDELLGLIKSSVVRELEHAVRLSGALKALRAT
jgi:hypothetical protein